MTQISLAPSSLRNAALMERAVKGRSLWDDARRRLFRNKAAVASMIVLGLFQVRPPVVEKTAGHGKRHGQDHPAEPPAPPRRH